MKKAEILATQPQPNPAKRFSKITYVVLELVKYMYNAKYSVRMGLFANLKIT
jgi:hypothetical protein